MSAVSGAEKTLRGHDLAIVIGAQVFRYYPYVAGDYLPEGTDLLQTTGKVGLTDRRERAAVRELVEEELDADRRVGDVDAGRALVGAGHAVARDRA